MFRSLAVALAIVLAAGAARAGEEATIVIDNFVFTPATLTVKPGTKITFVNHDDLPHNVVDDNGAFRSKALDTDESFARVFDTPGEFLYFCGLHPRMKGRIVVAP